MSKDYPFPSTSEKSNLFTTACAFVNDNNDIILNQVIKRLGTGNILEKNSDTTSKEYRFFLHLDTKYYSCDVPVIRFNSFEALAENQSKKENVFFALMVCASREELSDVFLARLSQFSKIESLDVKALILKEGTNNDGFTNKLNSISVDDIKLNKFAIARNIEIIHVFKEKDSCIQSTDSDDDEEIGTRGISRVVEVLETVKWNGLKLKQNPIGGIDHRRQLLEYLEEIDKFCWESNNKTKEKKEEKKEINSLDYPDSEDEEAILEWFDRPLTRNFKFNELFNSQQNSQFAPVQQSLLQNLHKNHLIRRCLEGSNKSNFPNKL